MSEQKGHPTRRNFLKGLGAGAIGLAIGPGLLKAEKNLSPMDGGRTKKGQLFRSVAPEAKVSLIKGNDRQQIVYQALKKIEDDVLASIERKKRILIKPNFVVTNRQLAATHVDAVRGILEFLRPHYKGEILIGESTISKAGTFDGFKNYGYLPLEKEYKVKLIDLNKQPWEYRYVFGRGHRPTPIRIISTFLDPDLYIISAAKMKTHDRVVTTLSLKNILLGAPLNDYQRNDKWLTHAIYTFSKETVLHYNMFHLAQEIYPDLGVIDGFEAMEGNGPVGGTPVDARVALASLDPLAMDTLATKLMGFDPSQIMYLVCMAEAGMGQGDLSKIKVLGTPIAECQYKFRPHVKMTEAYGFEP